MREDEDVMRTVSSREVYRNRWMTVREDEVEMLDGTRGIYGVVDKTDFALVVPVDTGGVWMVEQHRYPVGERCWEFPQGTWGEGRSGSPEQLARAELAEETGLRAVRLDHLGRRAGGGSGGSAGVRRRRATRHDRRRRSSPRHAAPIGQTETARGGSGNPVLASRRPSFRGVRRTNPEPRRRASGVGCIR